MIDDDVKCIICGYNLRGLSKKGLCPECAYSNAVSLRSPPPPSILVRIARILQPLCLTLAILCVIGNGLVHDVRGGGGTNTLNPTRLWKEAMYAGIFQISAGIVIVQIVLVMFFAESRAKWKQSLSTIVLCFLAAIGL